MRIELREGGGISGLARTTILDEAILKYTVGQREPFTRELTPEEHNSIVQALNGLAQAKPAVVYGPVGAPQTERFLETLHVNYLGAFSMDVVQDSRDLPPNAYFTLREALRRLLPQAVPLNLSIEWSETRAGELEQLIVVKDGKLTFHDAGRPQSGGRRLTDGETAKLRGLVERLEAANPPMRYGGMMEPGNFTGSTLCTTYNKIMAIDVVPDPVERPPAEYEAVVQQLHRLATGR